MSSETEAKSPPPAMGSSNLLARATSELNNLLQIISGTTWLIEDSLRGNTGLERYFKMLRTSIERAEKVTDDLVKQAGGTSQKVVMSGNATAFVKPKSAPPATAKPPCILVVDDEEMMLTLAKQVLSNAGYDVVTTPSGFECLNLLRDRPRAYDLVLLDFNMPFLDGEETFRRLLEIRPDVPVILCCGFMEQEKTERLMSAGLRGFLRKPVPPDEMVAQVRNTLQSLKYSRPDADARDVSAVS
jgi:CheY-like chemotaxis protein